MKVKREYFDISEALAAKILDVPSPEDLRKIEEWSFSSETLEFVDSVIYPENYSNNCQRLSKYSSTEAWKEVSKKIGYRKKIISYLLRFTKYAALLLIIMMFGRFLYWYKKGRVEVHKVVMKENILDKDTSTKLILDNGKNIKLSNNRCFVINEKDGSKIHKKKGLINYKNAKINNSKSSKICYNSISTPKGSEYSIILSDGTKVLLNSESIIKYPVSFFGNKRTVEVEGEAYFNVVKNIAKPFIVKVGNAEIKVLGTSFNVKAYSDENAITTTLVAGKVQISNTANKVTIKPGQQGIITKFGNEIKVSDVDVNLYVGWTKGIYYFKDQRIEDILRTLQRWYNFEVYYLDDNVKDIKLGGVLKRYSNIDPVVNMLQQTDLVIVKKEGNKIYITKK